MIAATLLLASAAAFAQDDARAQAEQRVRLASRLIADSPSAQRIQASGHAAAISHLDEGRLHLSSAEEALAAGDHAKARKAADESLHHLAMARRLVPDQPSQQLALRRRHEQQIAAVERLVEAWRVRAGANPDNALIDATGLVGQARSFGEAQRYDESLRALAAAEQRLLAGLARTFPAREVDYTSRSNEPAEQYRHEMAGFSALSELVPLAVRDLSPRAEARALIERYMQTAHTLHMQAQQRFESGDPAAGLSALRRATLEVQRALAAAGVVTPNPTGSPP